MTGEERKGGRVDGSRKVSCGLTSLVLLAFLAHLELGIFRLVGCDVRLVWSLGVQKKVLFVYILRFNMSLHIIS